MEHDFERKTRQYWSIDGLPELMIGGIALIMGAMQIAALLAPKSIAGFALILVPFLGILAIVFARRTIGAIKRRLTYPRTGYVAYRQPSRRNQLVGAVLGFGLGFMLLPLLFTAQLSPKFLPLVVGLIAGIGIAYLGFYFRMVRFYIQAVALVAAGALFWLAGVNSVVGAALVLLVMGIWSLASGTVVLLRYLNMTKEQE